MVSAAVGVVLGRAYSHGRNPGLKSLMDLYDYGKLINHYLPKHYFKMDFFKNFA